MPAKSKKQQKFMAAVANNPKFAKKVGVPKTVGEEIMKKGNKGKYQQGGEVKNKQAEKKKKKTTSLPAGLSGEVRYPNGEFVIPNRKALGGATEATRVMSRQEANSMTNEEYLEWIRDRIQEEEDKTNKVAKAKEDKAKKAADTTYNQEYKKSALEYGRRKAGFGGFGQTGDKNFLDKAGDWGRDKIGGALDSNRITSADDKARMKARKDVLGFKKGGKVKKVSKGGKVRGCGIAKQGVRKAKMVKMKGA